MTREEIQEFRVAIGLVARRLRQLYADQDQSRAVPPLQLAILTALRRDGQLTPGQIARDERVTPQAVAIATRELVRLGLVTRTPQTHDRRRVGLRLAEAGTSLLAHGDDAVLGPLAVAVELALSPQERQALPQLTQTLRRVAAQL